MGIKKRSRTYICDPLSGYKPTYKRIAYQMALLGATNIEIAAAFDVTVKTICEWKKLYPEFKKAIQQGGIIADANVAKALYTRAVGYTHKDTHLSNYQGVVTATPIVVHVQPDVQAQRTWLNVRRRPRLDNPEETPLPWSESKELVGAGGAPLIPTRRPKLDNLTDDQLDALVALAGEVDIEKQED